MDILEWLKVLLLGIVEGLTEWLPISSTGHMILVDEFIHLNVSDEFMEMFLVVIQLGAILAVVVLFWKQIFPFRFRNGIHLDRPKWIMWFKILVASIPAGVVGVLWDDVLNALFYNYVTVAVMLIAVGAVFILALGDGPLVPGPVQVDDHAVLHGGLLCEWMVRGLLLQGYHTSGKRARISLCPSRRKPEGAGAPRIKKVRRKSRRNFGIHSSGSKSEAGCLHRGQMKSSGRKSPSYT